MQAAIYAGLLNPQSNSSATIHTDCISGNCNFTSEKGATFSSLAMCHTCSDISNQVEIREGDGWLFNYSIPSSNIQVHPDDEILLSSVARTPWLSTDVHYWFSNPDLSMVPPPIFAFDSLMLQLPQGCTQDDFLDKISSCALRPYAITCAVSPCVKTYSASVTNFTYRETELHSQSLRTGFGQNGKFLLALAESPTLRGGAWTECNATTSSTTTNTKAFNATTLCMSTLR